MKIYIKNMVCDRCIMVVKQKLEALNFEVLSLKLGEADIQPIPDERSLNEIRKVFLSIGFELIEDKKRVLSEKIKVLIIEKINSFDLHTNINISDYLTAKLELDYHHLSHVFSEMELTTIEKFVITKKIEKVKEFLRYNELTISEIAWKLGYSSIQALSNQFKKETGFTPLDFKKKVISKAI